MRKPGSRGGRDDFSMRVKRAVSARVALLCSNPDCRAVTSGPQTSPEKAVNIGVASHISAAAIGGPRYNVRLTPAERSGISNAIWLCQNCAKLIDTDPARFSEGVLLKWKRDAELEAKHQLGKKRLVKRASSGAAVKKKLAMKRRMERDFAKAKSAEIIIHSEEDDLYPELWDRTGISNWFKVEFWGMYHNGFEVVLGVEYAVVAPDGRWAFVPGNQYDAIKEKVKVLELGRIPFRNVIDYDLDGDEYYNSPHFYCRFADDGQPYEEILAELTDAPYRQRLPSNQKVRFEQLEALLKAEKTSS